MNQNTKEKKRKEDVGQLKSERKRKKFEKNELRKKLRKLENRNKKKKI